MNTLELKIPPAILALVTAISIWCTSFLVPLWELPYPFRIIVSVLLMAFGVVVVMAGGNLFRRAHTTVNPTKPDSASSLVVSGVYRFTRNPMYLGVTLVLLGLAVIFLNLISLALVSFFTAYLTRFQIIPEERALENIFSAEYASYKKQVRRWL